MKHHLAKRSSTLAFQVPASSSMCVRVQTDVTSPIQIITILSATADIRSKSIIKNVLVTVLKESIVRKDTTRNRVP